MGRHSWVWRLPGRVRCLGPGHCPRRNLHLPREGVPQSPCRLDHIPTRSPRSPSEKTSLGGALEAVWGSSGASEGGSGAWTGNLEIQTKKKIRPGVGEEKGVIFCSHRNVSRLGAVHIYRILLPSSRSSLNAAGLAQGRLSSAFEVC